MSACTNAERIDFGAKSALPGSRSRRLRKPLAFTPSLQQNPITDSPPDSKRLNSSRWSPLVKCPACWFVLQLPTPRIQGQCENFRHHVTVLKERRRLTAYIAMGGDVRQLVPLQAEFASNARVNMAYLLARSWGATVGVRKIALGTVEKTAAESSDQPSDWQAARRHRLEVARSVSPVLRLIADRRHRKGLMMVMSCASAHC